MSVQVENFETIFGAKNNIQALRNKVLELAIQGKLVEQDINDEPASELLKKIKSERNRLMEEGIINKQKPLTPIREDNLYFKIPECWEWVRLGEVCSIFGRIGFRGYTKSDLVEAGNGAISLSPSNIINDKISYNFCTYISWHKYKESPEIMINEQDIILVKTGSSYGKSAMVNCLPEKATINPQLVVLKNILCLSKYLNYTLKAKNSRYQFEEFVIGTSIPTFSQTKLAELVIPLPPLNEQYRIVDKIESLMAEIDTLEESIQKKEHIVELLPKSVVDTIGNCQTGEELKEQLHFVIENFQTLFQTPESMQELRNIVLQLAIEGKLVQQDPIDEPASVLLKNIKTEKDKLVKEGKIKKEKLLPIIKNDEIPFRIPESWEWVRLGNICKKIGAGSTPTGGKSVYKENGVMFIRSQNVYNDGLRLSNVAFIDEAINNRMSGSQVESKDILLNITGASIGRCCVVPDDFGYANVNQHVTIIRLIDSSVKDFIQITMISNYIQKLIMDVQVGVSREGLSGVKLSNFIIPLPPIKEQIRIMQKVNSIMSLIDQMEDKMRHKVDLTEKMANL